MQLLNHKHSGLVVSTYTSDFTLVSCSNTSSIHVDKHGIHISINAYATDNIHILNMSVNIALLVWIFVVLPLVCSAKKRSY